MCIPGEQNTSRDKVNISETVQLHTMIAFKWQDDHENELIGDFGLHILTYAHTRACTHARTKLVGHFKARNFVIRLFYHVSCLYQGEVRVLKHCLIDMILLICKTSTSIGDLRALIHM